MPMIKPSDLTIRLRLIGGGNAELIYSENLTHVPKPIRELTAQLTAHHLGAEDYKWDGETFTFTLVGSESKMAIIGLAELCGFVNPDKVRELIDHLEKSNFIPFIDIDKARQIQFPSGITIGELKKQMDVSTTAGKTSKSILDMMEKLGIISAGDDVSSLSKLFNKEKSGGK